VGASRVLELDAAGAAFRRLAFTGARYGPTFWVRYSPPLFGALFALALPGQRRRVIENLRLVHGRRSGFAERVDVLRTFASYASCLAESLGAERADAQRARVIAHGQEQLKAALAAGRGAILVTAHIGPWDVAGALLARELGIPVTIAMRRERDERARDLHDGVRTRTGVSIVHLGEHALDGLSLLGKLRRGGIVAVQIDRPAPGGRMLDVTLFERPYAVPEGPFRLAALAQVPIFPTFARRSGYFAYEFSICPKIVVSRSARQMELATAAQRASDEMAAFLKAHATQWFNFG
jgi:lauroyl/myristoyl acyltransferase